MTRTRIASVVTLAALAAGASIAFVACGGQETAPPPEPAPAPAAAPAPPPAPTGPVPSLLMVQAQFVKEGGKPKPGPAKLTVWRKTGDSWSSDVVEDPDSNVFHKAMVYDGGILTIGAEGAKLKHWKHADGTWTGTVWWEQEWEGRFQRLRDIEIGDLDGDGADEIALATHDMGVVAVGDRNEDGSWTFAEYDKAADTFVHEVEIGDVDGDGKKEFYVTPSARNKASGESQPGGVARYDHKDGTYIRSEVVHWDESHAKEILVADTDANGTDELYVVKEGHVAKGKAGKVKLLDPVKIVRMDRDGSSYKEVVVAELQDKQCRFLVPGDVDGDGTLDLVAAGMDSGLWLLRRNDDGTFSNTLIDAKSGGFEHASHVADLDGDGKLEIYVAADKQKEFRSYTWNGQSFDKKSIAPIPAMHITWNVQDGLL